MRAILRNTVFVAIGFQPLLAAPPVPYNTVGTLITAILFASGILTIILLGAVLYQWKDLFFPMRYGRRTTILRCRDAAFMGIAGALFATVSMHSLIDRREARLPWILLAVSLPLLYGIQACMKSRRALPEANASGTHPDPGG